MKDNFLSLYLFLNAVMTLFNFIMVWAIIRKLDSSGRKTGEGVTDAK